MATGRGIIMKTTTNGPYAYTWTEDITHPELETVVTGKTLAQASSELGTLVNGMAGQVKKVTILSDSQ